MAHARELDVVRVFLRDDGTYPNSALPLLHYRLAVPEAATEGAPAFERRYVSNGYGGSWRNGVFAYHHYHTTTHEVLGVFAGTAKVLFGGDAGTAVTVGAGDLIVIPAGVAHKALEASGDFSVVAAYPDGRSPDMRWGRAGERPAADHSIAAVPIPTTDPIAGPQGPLVRLWGGAPRTR